MRRKIIIIAAILAVGLVVGGFFLFSGDKAEKDDRSTIPATARTFMKKMIDCDVQEATSLFAGEAKSSYMFFSGEVIEFANGWMFNEPLDKWRYYLDEKAVPNEMLIWHKDRPLPENRADCGDDIPVIYLQFNQMSKGKYSISWYTLSNEPFFYSDFSQDLWNKARASGGSRF